MSQANWLPALLVLNDFGGNWDAYLNALYGCYRKDFERVQLEFAGVRLALKRHPEISGKAATFWHLISEGVDEDARLPDLRRCERIGWVRAIFDAAGTDRVLQWSNQRQTKRGLESNIVLALPDFSFVVILRDRGSYMLLWTAYAVKNPARLRREYEQSL